MEPIVVIIAVLVLVAVVAGFVVASRPRRGEVLEPPPVGPDAEAPRRVGTEELERDQLDRPRGRGRRRDVDDLPARGGRHRTRAHSRGGGRERRARRGGRARGRDRGAPSFRDRLGRARSAFSGYVGSILSRSGIDEESWDELEEALIRADVGIGPATALLDAVRATVAEQKLTEPAQLIEAVKDEMKLRLGGEVELRRAEAGPTIWLFVGVNGVGKTTTIGKVGRRLGDEGADGRDGGG